MEPSFQTADVDAPRSSMAMARQLATYLDCPRRIRSAILVEFERAPSLETIRRFRDEHLAERMTPPERPAFKPHDGYYPADASRAAEYANQRFVRALQMARRA